MLMNAPPRPLVSGGACTSFEYGYARNVSLTMTMITGARHLQMPFYCTQRTHAIVHIIPPLLTLGAHAQEGYGSCRVCLSVCVCVCVCLSVKSHLTSGASVRLENAVTYSAGNEGQQICSVF